MVVCASNDKFAMPMTVMLKSISLNSSASLINAFILDGGISSESKEKIYTSLIDSKISLHFYKIDDSNILDMKTSQSISIAAYYRLLIADLLPKNIHRVIYLDCDLILEDDIRKLWSIPLNDKSLLAVPEMNRDAMHVSSPSGLKLYNELKIPKENKYFNSGVLMLNLDKWRANDISHNIFNYLRKYKEHVRWYDQDGMNAVLWNDWDELPPQWNVQSVLYMYNSWEESTFTQKIYNEIKKHPSMIHFTFDWYKPWNINCTHPLKSRFQYYLNLTQW